MVSGIEPLSDQCKASAPALLSLQLQKSQFYESLQRLAEGNLARERT